MSGLLKVVLVGLPNVGKSTLFNRLTRTHDALVSDTPGLTRDRRIGVAQSDESGEERRWLVYDTGGLGDTDDGMAELVAKQTEVAVESADIIVFVTDMRAGLMPAEIELAARLRATGRPVWLVVNKAESVEPHDAVAEFAALGLEPIFAVSATRRRGLPALVDAMAAAGAGRDAEPSPEGMRVTVVGRPNVGKSTLMNRLLGEERVLVSDTPGTTRDSVVAPFHYDGREFALVDTAGVRRRRSVRGGIEALSALKTFESMALSDVAILVCDASEGVASQDARIAARALDAGCGLVVALNKSDLLDSDSARQRLERTADLSLQFMDYVSRHLICARTGEGVGDLLKRAAQCCESTRATASTSRCTRILNEALEASPPPLVGGRRPRLRYANQAGVKPPRFILHGHRVDALAAPYRRYLANYYRRALGLHGVPVVLEFRATPNPYAADKR